MKSYKFKFLLGGVLTLYFHVVAGDAVVSNKMEKATETKPMATIVPVKTFNHRPAKAGTPILSSDPAFSESTPVRSRSHFPKDYKDYKPIPLPVVDRDTQVSVHKERNKWVSHDMRTGSDTFREISTVDFMKELQSNSTPGGLGEIPASNKTKPQADIGILNFTDLERINDPETYPWHINVKLYVRWVINGVTNGYISSGVLINPFHVLTCGHSVWNTERGGWADEVIVVPGYEDGNRPFGDASASWLHSWTEWKDHKNHDYDMAVIELDRPFIPLGWYGYGYHNNDSFYTNTTFHNPGYPGESPYDGEYMYDWNGSYDSTETHQLAINKYSYQGQSGSGSHYVNGNSRSVHSVLSGMEADITYFTRITQSKFNSIQSWISFDLPSSVDLIPGFVETTPESIRAGEQLASMTYRIINYSSTNYDGTVDVDVYLSNDDNISFIDDRLISSHSVSLNLNPKGRSTVTVTTPPTIPADVTSGDYWLGIILDTDNHTFNDDTDGQDASPISVTGPEDHYEPNNTLATAYDIGEKTWLNTINGYGRQWDEDWCRIHVDPVDYNRVVVTCLFADAEGDIDLELLDGNGITLALSDSSTDNEYIDYEVPDGGHYYLRVHYGDGYPVGNQGSTYDLWWDDLRPIPSVPTGVSATDGTYTDKVRITWNSVTGASYYRVYRNTSASSSGATLLSGDLTGTSFDDLSMTPGQTYYYWVKAGHSGGWSDFGYFEYGHAALLAPTSVSATDGTYTDRVRISWNSVNGASFYHVYRATSSGGSKASIGSWDTSTTFNDTSATPGLTYYYFVKAAVSYYGDNASGYSAYDTGIRALAAPTSVSATDGTYPDKVQVSWSSVSGASYYRVSRATSSGGSKSSISSWQTSTTFDDTSATPGTTYYYFVEAATSSSGANASEYSSYNAGWKTLAAPTGVSATDGTYAEKVGLSWNSVNEASYYHVYRATSSGGTKSSISSWQTSTTLDDTSATPGETHYYFVQAASSSSGAHASEYSSYDTGWRLLVAPIGVSATDGTYTHKIRIDWSSVSGATCYHVYRNTSGSPDGATNISDDITDTTFDDTTMIHGVTYYYWVKAGNALGWSEFSDSDSGYAAFSEDAYEENDTLATAWNFSTNETTWLSAINGAGILNPDDNTDWYQIDARPGSERLMITCLFSHAEGNIDIHLYDANTNLQAWSDSTNDHEYIDYEVSADGYYYLRVRDIYNNEVKSYDLWWDDVEIFQPPTGVSATDGLYTHQIQITWNAISNATHYRVYRQTSNHPGSATNISGDISGMAFNDTSMEIGETYYYWVKAGNALGWSEFSGSDSGFAAFSDDAYEENDTLTEAWDFSGHKKTWLSTIDGAGILNPDDDTDWYQVEARPGSEHLMITCLFSHAEGNIDVRLYDANTNLQAWSDSTNDHEYIDYEVSSDGYYYLRVRNLYNNEVQSYDLWWDDVEILQPPTGVLATDGLYTHQIQITWNAISNATHYRVHRQTYNHPGSATNISGDITGTAFNDTSMEIGETYYYWVKAGNALGWSEFSVSDSGFAAFADDAYEVDHFVWGSIGSQTRDVPFNVCLTARDTNNVLVTDFTNTVDLAAYLQTTTATTNVTIGVGSSSWGRPLYTLYHDARTQVIYRTNELPGSCVITSLALNVTQPPGQTLEQWTIRMKHTTLSSYGLGHEWGSNGWTVVYQNNETISTTNWVAFPLSTPFAYNGTDNLMIDFSFDNTSWSSSGMCLFTDAGENRSMYSQSDSQYGNPLTWTGTSPYPGRTTKVPNIRLGASVRAATPLSITPVTSGTFVDGAWCGNLTVLDVASNVYLRADDGNGHYGMTLLPFDVLFSPIKGPQWWIDYNALDLTASPDDYAVANSGQLKSIASKAREAMNDILTNSGGAGTAVNTMVNSFQSTSNYAVINLGQLKHVAVPFYDRLSPNHTNGWPVGMITGPYPWSGSTNSPGDYVIVNIGQLKYIFSFEISN